MGKLLNLYSLKRTLENFWETHINENIKFSCSVVYDELYAIEMLKTEQFGDVEVRIYANIFGGAYIKAKFKSYEIPKENRAKAWELINALNADATIWNCPIEANLFPNTFLFCTDKGEGTLMAFMGLHGADKREILDMLSYLIIYIVRCKQRSGYKLDERIKEILEQGNEAIPEYDDPYTDW